MNAPPGQSKDLGCAISISALFIAVMIIALLIPQDETTLQGDNTAARADKPQILATNTFACADQDDLDRIARIARRNDEAALRGLETELLIAGNCRLFTAGTKIHVIEATAPGRRTRFRLQNQTKEFWAPSAAPSSSPAPRE
jgi:hypothetical protein